LCVCVSYLISLFQTFYGRTRIAMDMHKYVSTWLSFWHSYKNMSERIWKTYFDSIFGPMFHDMFPGSKVFNEPKLRLITLHFQQVMLAYPKFKKELDTALADDTIPARRKVHLQNFKDLCDFFIPAVHADVNVLCLCSSLFWWICSTLFIIHDMEICYVRLRTQWL
jgi:hypothetical protein